MKDVSFGLDLEKRVSLREVFSDYKMLESRELTFCGWISKIEEEETYLNLYFKDGSSSQSANITIAKDQIDNYQQVAKATVGTSIILSASVIVIDDHTPFVLRANKIVISELAQKGYPLHQENLSLQELRKLSHLRPRTDVFYAIFRIRSVLMYKIHDFFYHRGFTCVTVPIVSCCSSTRLDEYFKVDIVSKKEEGKQKLFLKDSAQLENECFSTAFSNVYSYGPRFHVSNDAFEEDTPETWRLEAVMQFSDMDTNVAFVKQLLDYLFHNAVAEFQEEIELLDHVTKGRVQQHLLSVQEQDYEYITYTGAIEILNEKNSETLEWGNALTLEHERYLTEKFFGKPLIIMDYPKELKPFYMQVNKDGKTCRSFHFVFPYVGTVVIGSQREMKLEKLEERMKSQGLDMEKYSWYLDTRRFGSTLCTGFGMAVEKIVMLITGMKSIEDVIPFPREAGNCLY